MDTQGMIAGRWAARLLCGCLLLGVCGCSIQGFLAGQAAKAAYREFKKDQEKKKQEKAARGTSRPASSMIRQHILLASR